MSRLAIMRTLRVVVAVLLLGAGVAEAAPRIGDPAPPLAAPTMSGRSFRLAVPPGRPVVIDFFATWCGPCHAAVAALDAILSSYAGQVTLVIVDVGEPAETAQRFFAAHPPPRGAVVVLDRDGAISQAFGQKRLPTTFLLDAQGVIRHINRGYGPGYPGRVERWLRALLTI